MESRGRCLMEWPACVVRASRWKVRWIRSFGASAQILRKLLGSAGATSRQNTPVIRNSYSDLCVFHYAGSYSGNPNEITGKPLRVGKPILRTPQAILHTKTAILRTPTPNMRTGDLI